MSLSHTNFIPPSPRDETTETEPKTNEALGQEIEELQGKAQAILEGLGDDPSTEKVAEVKAQVGEIQGEIRTLEREQNERLVKEAVDGLKAQVKPLEDAIDELRERHASPIDFGFDAEERGRKGIETAYDEGEYSYFADVALAASGKPGSQKAQERLTEWYEQDGAKAMTEGTDSAGGYLVEPKLLDEILRERVRDSNIGNLLSSISVTTDSVEINSLNGGLTAGWVAELAEKPQADYTLARISASVFTAAGLAVASNQLLADARPSLDRFIATDIAKRIEEVKEIALLVGTGTGQPLGVLNTPGVGAVTHNGTADVENLLLQILAGIVQVQENHLAEPTAIAMRPSTWTRIITDPAADGKFTLGFPGEPQRTAADGLPGRSLYGYRVVLTPHIPNDLGVGSDETRVIVGKWDEGLVINREGYQFDRSEHVFFTSNQTVFRGEARVGATFARYPDAFSVVGGTGLVGF